MTDYQERFIQFLVRSNALRFGDFITKSGRRTPYFINTGEYKTGRQAAELGDYYADCIQTNEPQGIDALFGPAYKGIPLVTSASASLYLNYNRDLPWCFNRKEAPADSTTPLVGYLPQEGDRIAIVEDVVSAGTAVRETLEFFQQMDKRVDICSLYVSVDRMERGLGDRTTLEELQDNYGIRTHSIVTVRDILEYLHNRPLDGVVYIDDAVRERIEAYLTRYGSRARYN